MTDTRYRDFILSLDPFWYLRMDESLGATSLADVSGNGRHHAFIAGAANPALGLLESDPNPGQLSDGTRETTFTDLAVLNAVFLGSYSVINWFATTDVGRLNRLSGRNRSSGGSDTSSSQGLMLTGPAAQGTGVYFYTGSNQDVNAVFTPIGEYDYGDSLPHMAVGCRDATSSPVMQRLYLNGALVAERAEVMAPAASTHPHGVMGDNKYAGERWAGSHDEHAVVPLMSADQIRTAFCLGLPSRCGRRRPSLGRIGFG